MLLAKVDATLRRPLLAKALLVIADSILKDVVEVEDNDVGKRRRAAEFVSDAKEPDGKRNQRH